MKLLIIGHSVVDHIFEGGNEKIFPGGIHYASIGFRSMQEPNDNISLITSTSKDDSKYFEKAFSNFELKFSNPIEAIPHVNLYMDPNKERIEHYKNSAEPLKLSEDINLNEFDGIYINMITGNDLLPEQFVYLRNNFGGKIYLDVHTLSRGSGRDQHRFFRKIPDAESYLQSVDVIQVNELELQTLTPFNEKDKIIDAVFALGVEILIITKAEKGAEVFTKEGTHFSIDAMRVNSVNKVGCGDVFGSVFFYSYLSSNDLEKSFSLANKAAGIVTTYTKEEQFINLKNDII